MSLFALNHDVLALIATLQSDRDAYSLGQTCRSAYALTLPRRLSTVSIPAKALHSFCILALADEKRPCFVKELKYYYEPEDLPAIPSLARILQLACRLQSLWIDDAESLFAELDSAGLRVALQSCKTLRSLTLSQEHCLTAVTYEVLLAMTCPLVCIRILQVLNWGRGHIITALHPFTQTLTSLELGHSRTASTARRQGDRVGSDNIWPRMHTLRVRFRAPNELIRLSQCFPNLQVLHWDSPHACYAGTDHTKVAQWKSLDFVSCKYMPPIDARVRRIYLIRGRSDSPDNPLDMRLLRASPVVLTCPIRSDVMALLPQLSQSLRYLSLYDETAAVLDLRSPNGPGDIVALSIGKLPSDLQLHLVGLSFELATPGQAIQGFRASGAILSQTAQLMLSQFPTLRFLGFKGSMGASEDETSSFLWFRLTRDALGVICQVDCLSPLEGDKAESMLLALRE